MRETIRIIVTGAALCVVSTAFGAPGGAVGPAGPKAALPLGPVGEPAPASPAAEPEDGPGLGVLRTAGSLGVVLVLIGGFAAGSRWLAKRHGGIASQLGAGGRAPSGVAEVLARYPMGRGQSVVLLHIGRRVMVAFHATGGKNGPTMTPLSEVTDPEEVADLLMRTREPEAEAAQSRFAEAIAEAESRHAAFEPKPRPSAFRTVQTSAEGDRAELLSVSGDVGTLPERDGLDAVARLRERLSGLGVGGAS